MNHQPTSNPLRSEADAFRWVVGIGAGAAVVGVVAGAAGTRFGVLVAVGLIGLGIGRLWGMASAPAAATTRVQEGGGPRRVLVVADETIGAETLVDEVRYRCRATDAEALVVMPAISAHFRTPPTDASTAAEDPEARLERTVRTLEDDGLRARAEVGDADPLAAIANALRAFAADEVIVSTQPRGRSRWLELGVVARARDEIDLPVTHVVVDLEAGAERA